ncbi:twin transmembrane helix small protein [Methylocella sp. CPCC 101449]|jgi:hypothetical protein|nr:twin transmembrane helix small protein [Methylocella sp. CPCC 101449]MDT2020512.1 twin transmembrane helix small protein [Methylocella sp. CPCC 101449]HEV2574545.1 twin transmembrane helix small protein [Beijerinckiaceae bacterium]
MMTSGILPGIAVGAVVVVLLLGLFNMLRGGDPNLSQKLMRWRVILQFVAIIVVLAVLWFRGG